MHPLLTIATKAARRAGEIIARSIPRLESLQVQAKGRNDFVSEIDRAAEAAIIEIIHRHYPEHAILAEEGGAQGEHEVRWVIDPLDGTTNFLHGFPTFAVSIACEQKGKAEIGVVYDVMRQELFTATRGGGAYLENYRMRVSKQRTLEGALIATGFPFSATVAHGDAYLEMMRVIMRVAAGIRRPGAAALDLAYVAAGRCDGFWELGLQSWDTAAGSLLITEAGGHVGTFSGNAYMGGTSIVAGNPKVYAELLTAIAPHVPADLK
jgi:myo-inositol-1(or 4)-monophosphatase